MSRGKGQPDSPHLAMHRACTVFLATSTIRQKCMRRRGEVSNQRYARAQRGPGSALFLFERLCSCRSGLRQELEGRSAESQRLVRFWFVLCSRWNNSKKLRKPFSRCVQLDDSDAESWSNLAAALLRKDPEQVDKDGQNWCFRLS